MFPKLYLEVIQLRAHQQSVWVLISSKPLHDPNNPALLNWRTVSSNKESQQHMAYATAFSVKSLNSTGLPNPFYL